MSLRKQHPNLFWVPGLVLVNLGLFAAGLFTPVITLKSLYLFTDTFSIFLGIYVLYTEHEPFLAVFVFVFSFIFPLAKLGLLSVVWYRPMREPARVKALKRLEFLGKWSMMDVFVIALTVLAAKLSGFADARARYGIYVFAGAVVMSMLLTQFMMKLAGRPFSDKLPDPAV